MIDVVHGRKVSPCGVRGILAKMCVMRWRQRSVSGLSALWFPSARLWALQFSSRLLGNPPRILLLERSYCLGMTSYSAAQVLYLGGDGSVQVDFVVGSHILDVPEKLSQCHLPCRHWFRKRRPAHTGCGLLFVFP